MQPFAGAVKTRSTDASLPGIERPRACKSPKKTQGLCCARPARAADLPRRCVEGLPLARHNICCCPGAGRAADGPVSRAAPINPPGRADGRAWRSKKLGELLPTMRARSVEGLPRRCVGQADLPRVVEGDALAGACLMGSAAPRQCPPVPGRALSRAADLSRESLGTCWPGPFRLIRPVTFRPPWPPIWRADAMGCPWGRATMFGPIAALL